MNFLLQTWRLPLVILTAVAIAYSHDLGLHLSVSLVWMMPCSLLAGVTVGTTCSALVRPRRPVTATE